jgi:hypothetical protein
VEFNVGRAAFGFPAVETRNNIRLACLRKQDIARRIEGNRPSVHGCRRRFPMNWQGKVLLAALAAALAGCNGIGARDVDYSQQRAFSVDIDAALNHGPTAAQPGKVAREEPIGAIPYRSHDRHPL